jgi:hypothetical protein
MAKKRGGTDGWEQYEIPRNTKHRRRVGRSSYWIYPQPGELLWALWRDKQRIGEFRTVAQAKAWVKRNVD